jgi:aminoglycoside 6'-N-acetyltransferase
MGTVEDAAIVPRAEVLPRLVGDRVTLRPGGPEDVSALHQILSEPSVANWWGEPESQDDISANLLGEGEAFLLVIEVDGAVAGGIQYTEVSDPMYHSAGIDIYLSGRWQGRGLGAEALTLLVRFLLRERQHHRLVIDPAAANERAIRCYQSVGFRPVGIMRQYERGVDGVFHDGLLMDLVAGDIAVQVAGPLPP